jgi:hypothetical protein
MLRLRNLCLPQGWRIMDFLVNYPESCNMLTWMLDEPGLPQDYRHLEGAHIQPGHDTDDIRIALLADMHALNFTPNGHLTPAWCLAQSFQKQMFVHCTDKSVMRCCGQAMA